MMNVVRNTHKRTAQPAMKIAITRVKICRHAINAKEKQYNFSIRNNMEYCTTKADPESTQEEKLQHIGIDVSRRSNVSSTLGRKCNTDLRNMVHYADI